MTYIEDDNGIKQQLLLTVARANQATSVVRAIMLSNNSNNSFFGHLYGTQYISIVVDVGKLFDKSAVNLTRLVKIFKNRITLKEYDKAIKTIGTISGKYDDLIKQIILLRHNLGAHLNKDILNKMYKDPYSSEYEVDLNGVQSLLREVVVFLKSLSFVNITESKFLGERIGPKDVIDLLGLKIKPEVQQQFVKDLFKQNA